jgi:positive regulator of sigma E activity
MNYLRGFIPWIAFAVVSGFSWQWAAALGLVGSVGLLIQARAKRIPLDSQILEVSTLIYFAALTALSLSQPHSGLHQFTGAMSMGWLALTAFGGLALRRPFTLGIAKLQTPKELWNTSVFKRINYVITSVWALAFLITAIVLSIFDATQVSEVAAIIVQVAGFVLPALFTRTYPERVRARYAGQIANLSHASQES